MRLYEMMFLVDPGRAARDWEAIDDGISGLLERHGGEIRQKNRFDERKLSYPIEGMRRGTYLLYYVDMDPESVEELRNDLNLSEIVVRSLILVPKSDTVPEETRLGTMEAMSAEQIARAKEERSEDRSRSRYDSDDGAEDEDDGEEDGEEDDESSEESEKDAEESKGSSPAKEGTPADAGAGVADAGAGVADAGAGVADAGAGTEEGKD